MTNTESYFAALHPEPTRVMGGLVPPLTVGQICLLHHIKSPFLYGIPGLGDLTLAVLICQRTTHQAKTMMAQRRWLRVRTWWQAWLWRKRDFRDGIREFTAYLTHHHELPDYLVDKDKDSRSLGSPHLALLRLVHMRTYGRTAAQVDALPLLQANWEAFTSMEYEGQIELADTDIETMVATADGGNIANPIGDLPVDAALGQTEDILALLKSGSAPSTLSASPSNASDLSAPETPQLTTPELPNSSL